MKIFFFSFEYIQQELTNHKGVSGTKLIKVEDLNDYTPNLNIDWVTAINNQLMKELHVKQDGKILIHSPTTLKSLAQALDGIDKGIIADTFVMKFLYAHRFLYIVYPFDWRDEEYTSNSRSLQRWEQCLNFIKDNMRPALELLQSQSHEADNLAAEKFARDVVKDFVEQIKKFGDDVLSADDKEKLLEKIAKIDCIAGLFHRNFTVDHLDEYYNELELNGDENVVESALKIEKFYKKLRNDYRFSFVTDSKSFLDSKSQSELISYDSWSDELSKIYCAT